MFGIARSLRVMTIALATTAVLATAVPAVVPCAHAATQSSAPGLPVDANFASFARGFGCGIAIGLGAASAGPVGAAVGLGLCLMMAAQDSAE